jgi:RNA polymerase sigma-70 factor, ECF subfamily
VDHLTRLLTDARDGDRRALERFIAEMQTDVWRMCRYLGDPDSADDLAQESFERAIAALHRYRADGPARHWMLTITRRTCADATRRRGRRRRLDARLAREHQAVEVSNDRVELDELLDHLDVDRREAFVATQVLGLRYEEAAELLGCPIGTIRSRVARARSDLLDMLHRSDDEAGSGPSRSAG